MALFIDDSENNTNVRPKRNLIANCQEMALNLPSVPQCCAEGTAGLSLVCPQQEFGMCPVAEVGGGSWSRRSIACRHGNPGSSKQPCTHTTGNSEVAVEEGCGWRPQWQGPCTRLWPLYGDLGARRHGETGTVRAPRAWFPHTYNPGLPTPRVAVEARVSDRLLFWC